MSRPVWARGLKRCIIDLCGYIYMSRPVWARGLKLNNKSLCRIVVASRPVWARGLKLSDTHGKDLANGRAPCGRVD